MNGTKVLTAVVFVSVVLAASVAFAGQGPGWCCGMGRGQVMANLTPEQQKQVTALRLEFLKKTEPLGTQMRQKRIELMELAAKDKADEQTLEKKRQEIWDLQDKMRNERRAFQTKFRSLLTPEQKQQLGPGAGMGFGPGGGCGFGRGGCCGAGKGFGRGMGWAGGPGQI
jgi:Spy/CpxP family protein refolding chaperone